MASTVHDPTVLRAIAHPVRNRILGEMAAQGPMRAADLARELGIPANQASFHLRQLAKYGLVREAVGEGRDRRDRVWRLVDEDGLTVDTNQLLQQPGGDAAVRVFHSQAAAWGHVVVDAAYSPDREEGIHRSVTDQAIRLTQDEARELSAEVNALLQQWVQRTRGRDGSRRTYLWMSMLQPHPDPSGSGGPGRGGPAGSG